MFGWQPTEREHEARSILLDLARDAQHQAALVRDLGKSLTPAQREAVAVFISAADVLTTALSSASEQELCGGVAR